jgi:hypothetical protein
MLTSKTFILLPQTAKRLSRRRVDLGRSCIGHHIYLGAD